MSSYQKVSLCETIEDMSVGTILCWSEVMYEGIDKRYEGVYFKVVSQPCGPENFFTVRILKTHDSYYGNRTSAKEGTPRKEGDLDVYYGCPDHFYICKEEKKSELELVLGL